MLTPQRVPPGKHTIVVRMLRPEWLGGFTDYLWTVDVANPDFGKPMDDPAMGELKKAHPGKSVRFVALRRVSSAKEIMLAYPDEPVVAAVVADTSMSASTKDWDARSANFGWEPQMSIGPSITGENAARKVLMRFDLSGIPAETKVLGARLRLVLVPVGGASRLADGAKLQATALRREWNERHDEKQAMSCWMGPKFIFRSDKGETWGEMGAADPKTDFIPETLVETALAAFPAKDERLRVISLDVSDLVKQWHAGKLPNDGLVMSIEGQGCVGILASEHPEQHLRPTLVIACEGPAPKAVYTPSGPSLECIRDDARKAGKRLLMWFGRGDDPASIKAVRVTFADRGVKTILDRGYVFVSLDLAENAELAKTCGAWPGPAAAVSDPDGKTLGVITGAALTDPAAFREALNAIPPGKRNTNDE